MATAVTPRGDKRRLRLVAWLCGCGVVVAGLVYAGLNVHPARVAVAEAHAGSWKGRTAQGLEVAATTDGNYLDGVSVGVRVRCDGGARSETISWVPAPDAFTQRGDAVTVVQGPRSQRGTDGWTASTQGRLAMTLGDHPRGTASVVVRWRRGATRVTCRSGRVAFSLARAAS